MPPVQAVAVAERHVGAGVARRAAAHERAAQERAELGDRRLSPQDLASAAVVRWVPASAVVVFDDGPNYRPVFKRAGQSERRKRG